MTHHVAHKRIHQMTRPLLTPFLCPVIPSFPRNNAICRPALRIHPANVACKLLRDLERGEVTSLIVLRLEHNLAEGPGPSIQSSGRGERTFLSSKNNGSIQLWSAHELAGKVRHAKGNRRPGRTRGGRELASVRHLVVYPR